METNRQLKYKTNIKKSNEDIRKILNRSYSAHDAMTAKDIFIATYFKFLDKYGFSCTKSRSMAIMRLNICLLKQIVLFKTELK